MQSLQPLVCAPWYAVTVQPNHEHAAARALRARGFESYLPVQRATRRWSDRTKTLEAALFPGYVFCRFAAREKLDVMTTPSVRAIVSRGREPVPVDEAEITSIQALIATGRPVDVVPFLRIGQAVRISHGPFEALRGVIVRTGNDWRVVVSVEALGCSASVEVDADQILPERKPAVGIQLERRIHGHLQA